MNELLSPKEIVLANLEGEEKTFIISKIPAVPSREIAACYLPSALPKIGDYKLNEQMFFKMMKYVEVISGDANIRLTTPELINNHVDFRQASYLEKEMVMHNYGFFLQGTVSTFFEDFIKKGQALISKISTGSSELFSHQDGPHSTN